MRLLTVVAIGLAGMLDAPQRGGWAARPTMPLEEAGACPFEGCQFGAGTARGTVVAHRSRSTSAARSFTVRKGETVTALTGVLVITRPGCSSTEFFDALCDTRPERCDGRIVERQRSTWWVRSEWRRPSGLDQPGGRVRREGCLWRPMTPRTA